MALLNNDNMHSNVTLEQAAYEGCYNMTSIRAPSVTTINKVSAADSHELDALKNCMQGKHLAKDQSAAACRLQARSIEHPPHAHEPDVVLACYTPLSSQNAFNGAEGLTFVDMPKVTSVRKVRSAARRDPGACAS